MNLMSLAALYRSCLVYFAARAMAVLESETHITIGWHHRAIAYQLEQCLRGRVRRLIINQPPKTLKTHLVSIAYVAWLLMRNPALRIAIISYDEELASTQLRKVRQLIHSDFFRTLAPRTRIRTDKDTERHIETTAGGEVRAFSIEGGITGHGFDFIIIDDPQKASQAYSENDRRRTEEVFASVIANRWRNPKDGVLITVMQRLHVDDFTAYLLHTLENVVHLSFPAQLQEEEMEIEISDDFALRMPAGSLLEEDRLSESFLAEMRKLQGQANYEAQYLQAPMVSRGRVIDIEWLRDMREPGRYDHRIISIDPAFSQDRGNFTACLVADFTSNGDIELVFGQQVQHGFPQLLRWIRDLDQKWTPDLIAIETIGAGMSLPYLLQQVGIYHLGEIGAHPLSKVERMEAASPWIEAGHVWLPKSEDWAQQFMRILGAFPYGLSDDWPDALSQLVFYRRELLQRAGYHRLRRFPPPPPPEPRRRLPGGLHYRSWIETW